MATYSRPLSFHFFSICVPFWPNWVILLDWVPVTTSKITTSTRCFVYFDSLAILISFYSTLYFVENLPNQMFYKMSWWWYIWWYFECWIMYVTNSWKEINEINKAIFFHFFIKKKMFTISSGVFFVTFCNRVSNCKY